MISLRLSRTEALIVKSLLRYAAIAAFKHGYPGQEGKKRAVVRIIRALERAMEEEESELAR